MAGPALPWLYVPRAPQACVTSRARPSRRRLHPLNPLRLFFDEHLIWRLNRPFGGRAEAARIAQIRAAEAALDGQTLPQCAAALRALSLPATQLLAPEGEALWGAALALVARAIGFRLRDNQVACARALLVGSCVELRTGEGKTYAAGLAALLAARVGVNVHVITVNDYLARRDHDTLAPLAAAMGLSTAVLTQDMPDSERRRAYDADIVYGANKTFVFDHLRDLRDAQTRPGQPGRQRGQVLAIVDEADSVLVDDATTPMLLSEPAGGAVAEDLALFHALTAFADACEAGRDTLQDPYGVTRLTRSGIRRLERAAQDWRHPVARSFDLVDLAEKALAARFRFREGEAWLRHEAGIAMIDQSTGRLMPDRKWEYGLQQLVEIRAGVEPSPENRTVGQMTQQSFFRQYASLGALTGTAKECRPELWAIYHLPVETVAPHAPSRLNDLGLRVHRDAATKRADIQARATALAKEGRAVLIGLNDVAEAQLLAQSFEGTGCDFAVLDAMSEAEEAGLVGEAGRAGRITIATHLAGRGTDIAPAPEVVARGGLHVIIGSAMASERLVRQLCGRAGRKGEPGSYEQIIATSDRILSEGEQSLRRSFWSLVLRWPRLAGLALRRLQADRDSRARTARRLSLIGEQKLIQQLGYR